MRATIATPHTVLAALIPLALAVSTALSGQTGDSDWSVTTGDKASRRYAPLEQIDRGNVERLEIAWRWTSPDTDVAASNPRLQRPSMAVGVNQVTPIKVEDRLYATTGLSLAAAIDPGTGESLWLYNPKSYEQGRPPNVGFVHRGATYWSSEQGGRKQARIFYGSGDAILHAIDADTGEPVEAFGVGGRVDLTEGLRRPVSRRKYAVSSPVVICNDVLVVGSSISDGPVHPEGPPGDVRGFDPRTGEQLWTFHSIPQPGEHGHDTWEGESWKVTGNTNVWTTMSADEELGLVYLPFGTPTNDWFGGHRLGDNLFAESLVAVDCQTGERAWHFQAVHHGLWDYDFPTAAILGDVTVDGRRIRAAFQLSKQGFVYVLDRATGEPVWPIEERPVPQSGMLGERTSATQPFPTRPPPFDRQGMSDSDLIDFTPELLAEARLILQRYHYGPLFTPPSERGTIQVPGWTGGANWPGGAFDPETGMLYVPSYTSPVVLTLKQPDPARSSFDYVGSIQTDLKGPQGLPLIKPPYSRVTAYDMGRGDIVWSVPIGDGPRHHEALRHLDLGPLGDGARGHVLLTRTLLFVTSGANIFAQEGETELTADGQEEQLAQLDQAAAAGETPPPIGASKVRALDKETGALLWERILPGNSDGSPITYMHRGRQYLVIPIGGLDQPAEFVAFGLPE